MKIEKITMEDFEAALSNGTRRAPYGQNQGILKRAETEPVKLVFEETRQAISKQTALYVVRRKIGAQVRIIRRDNVLFIGPGDYLVANAD